MWSLFVFQSVSDEFEEKRRRSDPRTVKRNTRCRVLTRRENSRVDESRRRRVSLSVCDAV